MPAGRPRPPSNGLHARELVTPRLPHPPDSVGGHRLGTGPAAVSAPVAVEVVPLSGHLSAPTAAARVEPGLTGGRTDMFGPPGDNKVSQESPTPPGSPYPPPVSEAGIRRV